MKYKFKETYICSYIIIDINETIELLATNKWCSHFKVISSGESFILMNDELFKLNELAIKNS